MMNQVLDESNNDQSAVVRLCNLPSWTTQSTPLMYAAWGGREEGKGGSSCSSNLELCRLLVEQGGADPRQVNCNGQNALHWAAAAGHLDVCQYLAAERYRSSLSLAAAAASLQEDDSSLAESIDHGCILEEDQFGRTPMDYAMEYDRRDVMEWMMKVL